MKKFNFVTIIEGENILCIGRHDLVNSFINPNLIKYVIQNPLHQV